MFRGETSIEINQELDIIYKISKKKFVEYIAKMRSEVEVIEKKEDFLKLKISDLISHKKLTWILEVFFDDNNYTVKHVQTEGPIQGLVAVWQYSKISDKQTKIICVHEFFLKNIPLFKNAISNFVYKTQIKPGVDKLFNIIKDESEIIK